MDENDLLRDILLYRIDNQLLYNKSLVDVMNPDAISIFTRMRDDETRAIRKLRQKILRMEAEPGISTKKFPS